MLAVFSVLRVRSHVFVLPYLLFNHHLKTDFFFHFALRTFLYRLVLYIFPVPYLSLRKRPVAEDVVHKREIVLALMERIHYRAAELLERNVLILLSYCRLLPLFVLARFSHFLVDGTEYAVDEAAGGIASENFCELYRLVYRNLRRDLCTV